MSRLITALEYGYKVNQRIREGRDVQHPGDSRNNIAIVAFGINKNRKVHDG